MVEILEIGVIVALGAWVFTQFHLILAVRRIKSDIDAKRTATEGFVHDEVSRLEGAVGGFEGRVTAQMPPNLHGEIEEVRAEIEEINTGLRKEFEELPDRIQLAAAQQAGKAQQEMMAAAADLAGKTRKELALIDAQIPPELQATDIRGKIMKAILREPTPKERKEMGFVGETIWNFGRMKAAEWLQTQGPIGSSVTYRVSQTGSEEM